MGAVTAVVLDLDGVLVDTAALHAEAWRRTFDPLLAYRGVEPPFDSEREYRRHVDGKPRYEGAQSFLQSRRIELPWGDASDDPGFDSVCAVGNLKNRHYHDLLASEEVSPLPGVPELLTRLHDHEVKIAMVSFSQNAERVMKAAGLAGTVDVALGRSVLDDLGAPGKPDPALFLEAARRLDVAPGATAVVDDAEAGVAAGAAGGFRLVIGIDRGEGARLTEAGADVVVADVDRLASELLEPTAPRPLPRALERLDEILERLGAHPGVFTDYDGTLTGIVEDPADATIPPGTRETLARLAGCCPMAVVSGRDVRDVRAMVGIDDLIYAGSHGFEISGPDLHVEQDDAVELLPALDAVEDRLRSRLSDLEGVSVERKRFAVAVHTRRARSDAERQRAAEIVGEMSGETRGLELQIGKEIMELRPGVDWDKGRAIAFLVDSFDGVERALYLGDDTTDEDAFRRLRTMGGIGIRVDEAPGETDASYVLHDPDEAAEFLSKLADRLCAG